MSLEGKQTSTSPEARFLQVSLLPFSAIFVVSRLASEQTYGSKLIRSCLAPPLTRTKGPKGRVFAEVFCKPLTVHVDLACCKSLLALWEVWIVLRVASCSEVKQDSNLNHGDRVVSSLPPSRQTRPSQRRLCAQPRQMSSAAHLVSLSS